jgi:hypothetical protein
LQICDTLGVDKKVLYVSGEESSGQLKLRAERLSVNGKNLFVLTETNVENILNEAKAAGVKFFTYISVIKADKAPGVPMVHAKYLFEEELKKSGLTYCIHRPTGYFYDIVKVFRPMIEKGEVTLLGETAVHANVVSTEEFGAFIVEHIKDNNTMYNVGGKETYSYEEIANMCFEAAGKEPVIKRAPAVLFDVLAFINKFKKNGKEAILKFSKWTLTEEMVGDTHVGEMSFKQYIFDSFQK